MVTRFVFVDKIKIGRWRQGMAGMYLSRKQDYSSSNGISSPFYKMQLVFGFGSLTFVVRARRGIRTPEAGLGPGYIAKGRNRISKRHQRGFSLFKNGKVSSEKRAEVSTWWVCMVVDVILTFHKMLVPCSTFSTHVALYPTSAALGRYQTLRSVATGQIEAKHIHGRRVESMVLSGA